MSLTTSDHDKTVVDKRRDVYARLSAFGYGVGADAHLRPGDAGTLLAIIDSQRAVILAARALSETTSRELRAASVFGL